jgi:hypothetical protein
LSAIQAATEIAAPAVENARRTGDTARSLVEGAYPRNRATSPARSNRFLSEVRVA